jgi:hypothetical protein
MLEDSPFTVTGTVRLVVEPSPSCPTLLFPQHRTAPVGVSAHVEEPPAARATAEDELPLDEELLLDEEDELLAEELLVEELLLAPPVEVEALLLEVVSPELVLVPLVLVVPLVPELPPLLEPPELVLELPELVPVPPLPVVAPLPPAPPVSEVRSAEQPTSAATTAPPDIPM